MMFSWTTRIASGLFLDTRFNPTNTAPVFGADSLTTKLGNEMSESTIKESLFSAAMAAVTNGDKRVDKAAKPMATQYCLDGKATPYQDAFNDAVLAYNEGKGNKTRQAIISRAWALASKRAYYFLGEGGFRLSCPSVRSGGEVSILPIKEARDAAKAEQVAKTDKLLASIESAKLRSEQARIEKMRQATAESLANDLRETLALSGINLASVAKLIYNTNETWAEFVHAVEFVSTTETIAMATETSIEAITQETC
jgi:hypothetical protein